MLHVLGCTLLLLPGTPFADPPEKKDPEAPTIKEAAAKKEAELKWARSVLNDFLTLARDGEREQAALLLSESLKNVKPTNFVNNDISNRRLKSWEITATESAPEVDEIVFRGCCAGDGPEEGNVAELYARLVKEKDSGKWRLLNIKIGNWQKKEAPPKK